MSSSEQLEKTQDFIPKGTVKSAEISVGGVKIKVKTDATPHTLKQIRELVESKYQELEDKLTRGISTQQLTVLVAFNLAEELLQERAKFRALKRQVVESSERLVNRVESFLDKN